jgi:hypothetical protein
MAAVRFVRKRARHGADRCYVVAVGPPNSARIIGVVERWPARGRCYPAYWTARQPNLFLADTPPAPRYVLRSGGPDGPEPLPFGTRKAATARLVAVDQAQKVLADRLQAHARRVITRPACPCWSGYHFLHTPVCGCTLCEPGPTLAQVLAEVLANRGDRVHA